MVHFTEINQILCPYSMLQDVGREATPKLAKKKLSQILANNIDNGVRGAGLRIYVRYCIPDTNIFFKITASAAGVATVITFLVVISIKILLLRKD